MCGIIAVVRRPSTRPVPEMDSVVELVSDLGPLVRGADDTTAALRETADRLAAADSLLRGVPGLELMLGHRGLIETIAHHVETLAGVIGTVESELDADADIDTAELERRNQELVRVRDGMWALTNDRIRAAEAGPRIFNE